ncbi:MAG TPA: ribonuclease HIII [Bacillales bacterium]|nr:ribonuclease HIII [Bacillales bacterium]
MRQTVLKCSKQTLERMKAHYGPYIQSKKPGASLFFAKPPGCAVTAYLSGKVLFQGKTCETEAARWQGESTAAKKKAPTAGDTRWLPPKNLATLSVIGSDEVGTGDYFGPMTVTAAFIASDQLKELQSVGLKDSKQLSDLQIDALAETIKPLITYKQLTLANRKYNELFEGGMNQGKMKAMLHNHAIRHVIHQLKEEGTPYDGILIDQFAKPGVYYNYLKGQPEIINDRVWFQTKAEGLHLSVAAASIIARQAFVKEMDALSEKVGMGLPKGAGAQVDAAAAQLIREQGKDVLRDVAKLHFANTQKAFELTRQ